MWLQRPNEKIWKGRTWEGELKQEMINPSQSEVRRVQIMGWSYSFVKDCEEEFSHSSFWKHEFVSQNLALISVRRNPNGGIMGPTLLFLLFDERVAAVVQCVGWPWWQWAAGMRQAWVTSSSMQGKTSVHGGNGPVRHRSGSTLSWSVGVLSLF